jgi:hypothetical protein
MVHPRSLGNGDDPLLNARLAELEARSTAEGTLVVVGGDLETEAAVGMSRCRRRFKQVIAVTFPGHRFGPGSTKDRWQGETKTMEVVRLLARSGVRAVVLGPGDSIRNGWASLSRVSTGGDAEWDRKHEPA